MMTGLSWRKVAPYGEEIVLLQNGESEGCDQKSAAKMLCKDDKRAHCIREEETGGKCAK